uniref:Uncharacterized protein n=1 Tax=Anopheles atroparvus TaxID=41427 RepID=A0AAG5CZA9_ANOAO
MCRRPGQFPSKLPLALALILSTVVLRLDARFLKITKQPAGTVGIVPSDEDGESVHYVPMASVSAEIDREKGNEMISVKLLNQFHTRSFKAAEDSETIYTEEPSPPTGPNYETINLPEQNGGAMDASPPIEADHIDVKENVIEDDFLPIEPMVDKPLRDDSRVPEKQSITQASDGAARASTVGVVSATGNRSTSTTLTTTTTRTTTTIRKVRRKSIVTSSKVAASSTTTQRSRPTTSATVPPRLTRTSRKPPAPRIDITKLNLEHLENELVSYPNLGHLQAPQASARLLPRSIRPQNKAQPSEEAPTCGCQHRKRSLAPHQFSSEENAELAGDYDDYDYDYNDVRRSAPRFDKLGDGPMLFPVMSRLLAPASSEPQEGSVERAEMVHGTLERLMGIVTIFSHVDEFIQRKTKQSIRRLARLYDSEEMY